MPNHKRHPNEAEELYRKAVEYGHRGDVYHAVKLCKLVARLSPDWSAPYAYLGGIYRSRKEWRPALHYCGKAIEHNPLNDAAWENMAMAATALGQWATAREAWNHLGFKLKISEDEPHLDLGIVPICLNPGTQPEIVEAHRIDPARAVIAGIPQPSSGRRFRDVVLLENKSNRTVNLNGQNIGVFDEIERFEASRYKTWAVILQTDTQADVDILAKLCTDADLGFDNWSNALRFFQSHLHPKVSEYFDRAIFGQQKRDFFLVAIAAKRAAEVEWVLRAWEVITLKSYDGLELLI